MTTTSRIKQPGAKSFRAAKTVPRIPRYPYRRGYGAKRIRGKTRDCGRVEDGWEAAEALQNRQREDLHAACESRDHGARITASDLCDYYLDDCEERVDIEETRETIRDDSLRAAKIVAAFVGVALLSSGLNHRVSQPFHRSLDLLVMGTGGTDHERRWLFGMIDTWLSRLTLCPAHHDDLPTFGLQLPTMSNPSSIGNAG